MIRTKIICTIGPAVNTYEKIKALALAGMNVARLNFSHGTHDEHLKVINIIKDVRKELKIPLAIMLDTKGPEIRLRSIKDGEVYLETGARWLLVKDDIVGDQFRIAITPACVLDKLQPDMKILFDDGYISAHVVEVAGNGVVVEIENSGVVRSGKGVNVPNVSLDLPAFTEKDVADIRFGCRNEIDIIAASFVRSAEHVLAIKRLLEEEKRGDILIIAKIENSEGVQNFDNIIQVADGIMIARGDLGVEVPLSHVPKLQKMMIRKCYLAGKPSVTATQMLESMINNPRPTRAEVSDVANAIYDSTTAVMLSGETAIGKYPLQVVQVMKSVVMEAEQDFDYRNFFDFHAKLVYHDVPSALTLAAVKTAYSSNAKAIFACTSSGTTARLLARLRPSIPILAMTSNERSYHQMVLNWGVTPILGGECHTLAEAFHMISEYALERHVVSNGDLVVVTAGYPFGIAGTTNTMLVESIGDVLVRGESGVGRFIHGNISVLLSAEAKRPYAVRGQLLLMAKCDESYLPLIEESAGIILQNHIDDAASEKFALQIAEKLGKTAIVRADGALRTLKEGQLVTLDPGKALVYKGVVL
ncbi:MAG: pyruvate kinase [Parachlamydiaceae bacterium]